MFKEGDIVVIIGNKSGYDGRYKGKLAKIVRRSDGPVVATAENNGIVRIKLLVPESTNSPIPFYVDDLAKV